MKAGWAAVQVRSAINTEGELFSRLREAIAHWPVFRVFTHARE